MRIKENRGGYTMWLSKSDTYCWARRPGKNWPGSTTSGHSLVVDVDDHGLCDLTVDGKSGVDLDGNELDAIVADHLPTGLRHRWPCWESPIL